MPRGLGRFTGEFRPSLWRTALATRPGRKIAVGRNFRVVGSRRIDTQGGRLDLGLMKRGFVDPRDGGLLRVEGRLTTHGVVRIGHGNKWHVGPSAALAVGRDTYFSPGSLVVISVGFEIGDRCAVGWNCHILDDSSHPLDDSIQAAPVRIGSHVWIGSGVTILPGAVIADNCVVAANATVAGEFLEPGCLIGGLPARVIRRGVRWG